MFLSWSLSYKDARDKHHSKDNLKRHDIVKLMNSFNIRASNPCQFLPQDLVKEFSVMHPKKRLIETLKTEDTYLFTSYEELITLYKKRNDVQVVL